MTPRPPHGHEPELRPRSAQAQRLRTQASEMKTDHLEIDLTRTLEALVRQRTATFSEEAIEEVAEMMVMFIEGRLKAHIDTHGGMPLAAKIKIDVEFQRPNPLFTSGKPT